MGETTTHAMGDDAHGAGEPEDAFAFTGTWREYLPIALSNLALTIVTLGLYRFWAKARERRYLWSRTRFIDDRLEWTGTGREMFVGFLVAMLVIAPPFLFIQFGFQALILRGYKVAAGAAFLAVYLFLLYLGGFAQFRALRYRLARTYWHGIRGGAEDAGFGYGKSALWKPLVGFFALGLLVPWAMVSLWNERWNAMSFGPHRFRSEAMSGGLMLRWILLLVSPFVVVLIVMFFAFVAALVGAASGFTMPTYGATDNAGSFAVIALAILAFVLLFYGLIGIIGLGYYAAYFREVVGKLSLHQLDFTFSARSKGWIKLFLGDVVLVVGTLGIGICFLGYRHWSFFIRHLGAVGEIDLASLTQSTSIAPREAEGFADAFDIGAL